MNGNPKRRRGPLLWLAGRSRAFWIVFTIYLSVLYVLSAGPACWLTAQPPPSFPGGGIGGKGGFGGTPMPPRTSPTVKGLMIVYWPLGTLILKGGEWISPLRSWLTLFVQPGECAWIPYTHNGKECSICL